MTLATVKAVAYVRVSSKEQEREGFSIPAQKKLIYDYAAQNGIQIVKLFEEAETAKRAGRKQFQAMLEYLAKHPDVKTVLVEKTDRLYRNFNDHVALDIDRNGFTIHFVTERQTLSKDSRSHEKLMHDMKLVLSKNYVNNLAEEVKKGQTEKASQGIWPSSAPYGYKNTIAPDRSKIIEPDAKEAPYIIRAFELMASGNHSLQTLTNEMHRQGARPKSGGKISKSAWQTHLQRHSTTAIFSGRENGMRASINPLLARTCLIVLRLP